MYLVWVLCSGIEESAAPAPVQAKTKSRASAVARHIMAGGGGGSPVASTSSKPPPADAALAEAILAEALETGKMPPGGLPMATLAVPVGVGYGGVEWAGLRVVGQKLGLKKSASAPSADDTDRLYSCYFTALTAMLAGQHATRFRDRWPWLELAAQMVRRSPLLPAAAELLRNACVEDMARRNALYVSLLALLETLAGDAATVDVLRDPMTLYPAAAQVPAVTLGGRGKAAAADGDRFEESESIAALVSRNRATYADTLKHAATYRDDFNADDGDKMLAACRRYVALADALGAPSEAAAVAPARGRSTRAKAARQAQLDSWNSWQAWQKEHCVADLPEEEILKSFAYTPLAAGLIIPPKGRMRRLITDLAALRTSLPQGIFVRHGTSRIDIMKVLIVGPKSTPYEGGLWEFSLFCPADYPQSPPLMRNHTTGSGRIRFNPNLYNDGSGML